MEKVHPIETARMRFMKKSFTADIRKTVQDLTSYLVDIQFRTEEDESSIVILGNRMGLPAAEKRILDMVNLIVCVDHPVTKPGRSGMWVSISNHQTLASHLIVTVLAALFGDGNYPQL